MTRQELNAFYKKLDDKVLELSRPFMKIHDNFQIETGFLMVITARTKMVSGKWIIRLVFMKN